MTWTFEIACFRISCDECFYFLVYCECCFIIVHQRMTVIRNPVRKIERVPDELEPAGKRDIEPIDADVEISVDPLVMVEDPETVEQLVSHQSQ